VGRVHRRCLRWVDRYNRHKFAVTGRGGSSICRFGRPLLAADQS
jgi:hypothetical protein